MVFLKRTCPEHGEASVCIASDARFYWLAKGKSENGDCGCGNGSCCSADGSNTGTLGRNADPGEALGIHGKTFHLPRARLRHRKFPQPGLSDVLLWIHLRGVDEKVDAVPLA